MIRVWVRVMIWDRVRVIVRVSVAVRVSKELGSDFDPRVRVRLCCACVSSGCHLLNVRLLRLFSPFIPIVHDSGFVSYVY